MLKALLLAYSFYSLSVTPVHDAEVRRLVRTLDSSLYDKREAAHSSLGDMKPARVRRALELAEKYPASPEQRARARRLMTPLRLIDLSSDAAWLDREFSRDRMPCCDSAWIDLSVMDYASDKTHLHQWFYDQMWYLKPDFCDVSDKDKHYFKSWPQYRTATKRWALYQLEDGVSRWQIKLTLEWMLCKEFAKTRFEQRNAKVKPPLVPIKLIVKPRPGPVE